MSYLTFALLTEDVNFGRRSRACITQQADYIPSTQPDTAADVKALCNALLKGEPAQTVAMLQGICAGPGFDTLVDNGDGTIDSSKVTDDDMLAQCQAMMPKVAALYYDSTGAPIE